MRRNIFNALYGDNEDTPPRPQQRRRINPHNLQNQENSANSFQEVNRQLSDSAVLNQLEVDQSGAAIRNNQAESDHSARIDVSSQNIMQTQEDQVAKALDLIERNREEEINAARKALEEELEFVLGEEKSNSDKKNLKPTTLEQLEVRRLKQSQEGGAQNTFPLKK